MTWRRFFVAFLFWFSVSLFAQEASPFDLNSAKWALQFGGPLFSLTLVGFWFYRRDFKRNIEDLREDRKVILAALTNNTSSNERLTSEVSRLARTMEAIEFRHSGSR